MPFYSVLPDTRRYPAFHQFGPDPEPVDDEGPRSPSMSYQRIAEDLEQILDGAGRLIEGRWPFQTAMADYVVRMLAIRGGRTELLWSIDAVHARYLPGYHQQSHDQVRSGRSGGTVVRPPGRAAR